VSGLMLWIGIAFEFPLVIFVLSLMGIAKPKFMVQQWRIAVVIIAVIAAVITPTVDPVNMALVMGPMIVLYFLSIGLSFLANINRRKEAMNLSK
jgi:sec-independent protein translocase protein TatC